MCDMELGLFGVDDIIRSPQHHHCGLCWAWGASLRTTQATCGKLRTGKAYEGSDPLKDMASLQDAGPRKRPARLFSAAAASRLGHEVHQANPAFGLQRCPKTLLH